MSVNNMVLLIGYVGSHIRVKKLLDGSKRVEIRMATHERCTNKAGQDIAITTWHDVIAWDGVAEMAEQSFVKASHIRVNGRILYRTYDVLSGHTRYVTEIRAEYLQNLDR
jgi:single-strand DNA-binding protein